MASPLVGEGSLGPGAEVSYGAKTMTEEDAVRIVRLWIQHLERGTIGEELLHATLDAEEAITRYRQKLESA